MVAMVVATVMTTILARTTTTPVRTTRMARLTTAVAAAFLPDRQQSIKCGSRRNGACNGNSGGNSNRVVTVKVTTVRTARMTTTTAAMATAVAVAFLPTAAMFILAAVLGSWVLGTYIL